MRLNQLSNLAPRLLSGTYSDADNGVAICLTWDANALTPRRLAEIAQHFSEVLPAAQRLDEVTGQAEASMTAVAASLTARVELAEKLHAVHARALVGYVTAWDVTLDEAGTPAPVTEEVFLQLSLGLPEAIWTFCREETEPKKTPLTATAGQTNGVTSDMEMQRTTAPRSATEQVSDESPLML